MVEKKKLIKSLFDKYFYIVIKRKRMGSVFVQQLRQRQQHNDEMNIVKTLWKQERVCVDIIREKIIELTVEIDKLKKQVEIQAGGDNKQTALFEGSIKKNQELELKADREQITILRKEKVKKVNIDNRELEKNSQKQTRDLENEKRLLFCDLNDYKQNLAMFKPKMEHCLKTLTSLNLAFLKQGLFVEIKDDVKRLKGELSEKDTELQKKVEAKRASDQHSNSERTKMKKKKLKYLKKQLKYQKSNFKEELHSVKAQANADLDSLAEKNGQRRIDSANNTKR
ncbi:hypothetical protein RFI_30350 [Reticulomyxa filosa]|uniref:Uncharacterized protein n=1 Tax=Reticulomyxa filosa TaxID=46433 RepID=X6M0V7_RETFI|nr:hypothetical protein RFI_30350 [Reticulomyxa filosa]|eukprot:ETO07042.1 hypothetical protein RFI_30350 [Reticulomyxa filosa]